MKHLKAISEADLNFATNLNNSLKANNDVIDDQNKINMKTKNEFLSFKTKSLINESDELKRMLLNSKLN
jgi:hypothetical protein